MMQLTLAAGRGFGKHGRLTRKAEFCALIEPHYPKAGNGRPR